jgi:hypothetical protein
MRNNQIILTEMQIYAPNYEPLLFFLLFRWFFDELFYSPFSPIGIKSSASEPIGSDEDRK